MHPSRVPTAPGMLLSLFILGIAGVGLAGDQPRTLPRSFGQARLGMPLEELIRLQPHLGKARRQNLATMTVIARPSDPYIQRIAYRFHAGTLYEVEIKYRPDRLPDGAGGLVARLKESYGPPKVDRAQEVDIDSYDISRRRTVWEDDRTRITLLERQSFEGGTHSIHISLTMTDLELARRRDVEQLEQLKRKLKTIPIPLPEGKVTA